MPRGASTGTFALVPMFRFEPAVSGIMLVEFRSQVDNSIQSGCSLNTQSRGIPSSEAILEDMDQRHVGPQGQAQSCELLEEGTQGIGAELDPFSHNAFACQGDQGHAIITSSLGPTLKSQLCALRSEDPSAVFTVRSINKLGFSSARILREHFMQYGGVKDVHVAQSRVRPSRNRRWRNRAVNLGFVVMRSPETVATILREGPEHVIKNVCILTQQFHLHHEQEDENFHSEDDVSDK